MSVIYKALSAIDADHDRTGANDQVRLRIAEGRTVSAAGLALIVVGVVVALSAVVVMAATRFSGSIEPPKIVSSPSGDDRATPAFASRVVESGPSSVQQSAFANDAPTGVAEHDTGAADQPPAPDADVQQPREARTATGNDSKRYRFERGAAEHRMASAPTIAADPENSPDSTMGSAVGQVTPKPGDAPSRTLPKHAGGSAKSTRDSPRAITVTPVDLPLQTASLDDGILWFPGSARTIVTENSIAAASSQGGASSPVVNATATDGGIHAQTAPQRAEEPQQYDPRQVSVTRRGDTQRVNVLNLRLSEALRLRRSNEVLRILSELQRIVGADSIFMLKTRAYTQLALDGDMTLAMDLLREVLSRDPGDAEAAINMAVAEIRVGERQLARKRLEGLAMLHPNDARISALLKTLK